MQRIVKVSLFDQQLLSISCVSLSNYRSLNVAVEHYKQYVHSMANFLGINHEIRHEFNIGTSSRFRGYSAKMDDRLAVTFNQ